MKYLENIEPREYQQKIFETCSKKNCLVVLPTGIGKTLIALMLTVRRMEEYPEEKIVFLAPTKPLAEQHLNTFKKHLPELFADMQLFTGKINSSNRKKIWKTADIIFSTPQCIANDLKNRLYDVSEVSLLIEDEAHKCIRNYAYNYIAQKYMQQAKHKRILGLTASPGGDSNKIKEICRNLFIDEVEVRTRNSEDVIEYLQELEFEKIFVDFPPELYELKIILEKLFNRYVDDLKKRRVLWDFPSKTNLIKLQRRLIMNISKEKNFNNMLALSGCAQAIKIQHILDLLETQNISNVQTYLKELFKQASEKKSRGVEKLVQNPEINLINIKINELMIKDFKHPKIDKLIEIINKEINENKKFKAIVFTQYRESAATISKLLNKIKGINSKVFIGQAKKLGSGMSQNEQRDILEEFSSGKINIICATSIAEEGLDIPEVNDVIFYEPVPSAIRAIQRAGRTARLMKGKLIILLTKKTRDETNYYVSRAKEKKMYGAIEKIKKEFSSKEKQKTLQ